MTHAWCSDVSRDAAVRAAEDGRTGPLPTLDEAISRAGQIGVEEPRADPKCTERDIATNGLRTERLTLEITGAPGWRVNVTGRDVESVRVVEEPKLAPEANADAESNLPRGWLTGEERHYIKLAADCAKAAWDYNLGQQLENLLARSTPPEVVLPPMVIAYDDMDMLKETLAAAGVKVKEVG